MKCKIDNGAEVEGTPAELAEFLKAYAERKEELDREEERKAQFERRSAAAKIAATHRVRRNTPFKSLLGMKGDEFLARDEHARVKTVDELVQNFYDAGIPATVSKSRMKRYVRQWKLRNFPQE